MKKQCLIEMNQLERLRALVEGGALAKTEQRRMRPSPGYSHASWRIAGAWFAWVHSSHGRFAAPATRLLFFASQFRWSASERPHFSAFSTNANNAVVAGSSGLPRSALILVCVVSLAPNTVTGTSALFSTFPRRWAWAVTSGWLATYRIRNGGMPLFLATCVTAEKSLCFAASLPNLMR